jgi:dTMP kinase
MMSNHDGTFIVFEGGEGAGKGTQIDLLKDKLPDNAIFTKEPGGTEVAEKIRSILLSPDNEIATRTELALFCAARGDHVQKIIAPALESNRIVVSDRFDLSTVAYQIYGRKQKQHKEYLYNFSEYMVGNVRPDLYIYLDVPVEVGLKRVGGRDKENSRLDQETLDFHQRVRKSYHELVEEYDNCIQIDATQPIEAVGISAEKAISKHTQINIGDM